MKSFSTLNDETYQALFRYAAALTGCDQKGFDVLQEVIIRWGKQNKNAIDQPLAYLKRMIKNEVIDQYKIQKRRNDLLDNHANYSTDLVSEASLEDLLIDQMTLGKIWKTLVPKDREILYLWAVEGMSAREMAIHLNTKRSTILSQMSRLKQRLQQKYSSRGLADEK